MGNDGTGNGGTGQRESVRERTVSRMKVLAGTTVAGVAVACGYGVVDPLPAPSCFSEPIPGVTASFVDAPPGRAAEGVRFMQITLTFPQNDGSAFVSASAFEAAGPSLEVVSRATRTGAHDMIVRVPERVKAFRVALSTSCPEQKSGTRTVSVTIRDDDGIEVIVY